MTTRGQGCNTLVVTRRRPPTSRPTSPGGTSRRSIETIGRASRGGHHLSANRARGLSPSQDLRIRAIIFGTMPTKHPAADKPQMLQGTRGGKRK